jgi:endonuclease YncB( thermonuclease family)
MSGRLSGLASLLLLAGTLHAEPRSATLDALRSDAAAVAAPAVPVGAPALKPGDRFKAKVLRVLDADTVVVAYNGETHIRFSGVDAPEIAHPEAAKEGQPYGDEAAAFVRGLCDGKTVTVEVEDTDHYGRTVGWIILPDGRNLQKEELKAGWAWWNFFYNKDEELNKLENDAIKAGVGLWAGKAIGGVRHPEAPWVFRRRIDAGIKRVLPGELAEFAVTRMADGDTAALGLKTPVYNYIRLAGIDAPEVAHCTVCGPGTKPGQPFGKEAGARSQELVEAQGMKIKVRIEDVDPYGRIVGWIELKNGRTLNETLVEEGLAWWYQKYYPDLGELGKKEKAARDARLGLWADPKPVPPWEFRRSQRGGKPGKDSVELLSSN